MNKDAVIRQSQHTIKRLEALRNCGDGTLIHDTEVWIATVNGFIRFVNKPGRLSVDEILGDLISACVGAESFMVQVAQNTHRRSV